MIIKPVEMKYRTNRFSRFCVFCVYQVGC